MISVLPSVTRADQRHRAVGLAVAHAGGRFVEQDDLGAAGDGDADLQRALLGIGQQAGLQIAPVESFSRSSNWSAASFSAFCRPSRCQNE